MARAEDNYTVRRFVICTVHSVLLREHFEVEEIPDHVV
jgi:hypothetical protein